MKKVVTWVLCAILVMGLCITTAGCSSSNEKQAGNESKQFKVGLECGYAPFNWTQTDNANGAVPISGGQDFAGGYDIEIAKLLAKEMGKELVIVKTTWTGLVPAVQAGTIDAIIAGMSPTAERKKTIDFSNYYYNSDLVIVVKKGSTYEKAASLKDLSGAKITAQLDTLHYTVIDQIPNVKKQTAMDDFPAMRVALESGIIDGYVSERPEGISAAAANNKFAMVEFPAGNGFKVSQDDISIAVGIKKGNTELLNSINKILAGLTDEQKKALMEQAIKNQPAAK